MGLFSGHKRRNDEYQGFRKYTEGAELRGGTIAGMPSNGDSRSQSLTNGAGQAAMAALRMHQQSSGTFNRGQVGLNASLRERPSSIGGKPASLRSVPSRSNSLRSYVYTPSASYDPVHRSIRNNAARSSSLTLKSQQGRKHHLDLDRRSFDERPFISEEEETETVVTSTTKVVDAMGRTQSITTKTVKTLHDGSNVIETVTKNVSRTNSRNNSLRTNSLRNNSLLSNNVNSINLSKIDEDLKDFDYDYEVDNGYKIPTLNLELGEGLKPAMNGKGHVKSSNEADLKFSPVEETAKDSLNSSPKKPLKSILKNNKRYSVYYDEDSNAYVDAVEDLDEAKESSPAIIVEGTKSKATLNQKGMLSPPYSPTKSRYTPSQSKAYSPKFDSPKDFLNDMGSNISVQSPNSSIKFQEKVETIPISNEEGKEKETIDSELFAAAMKAAHKKVYGSQPESNNPVNIGKVPTLSKRKSFLKLSGKQKTEDPGITSDYVYKTHPKEFSGYSLRNKENQKEPQSKAKQDIKEEEDHKLDEKQPKSRSMIFFRRKKHTENSKKNADDGSHSEASTGEVEPHMSNENNIEIINSKPTTASIDDSSNEDKIDKFPYSPPKTEVKASDVMTDQILTTDVKKSINNNEKVNNSEDNVNNFVQLDKIGNSLDGSNMDSEHKINQSNEDLNNSRVLNFEKDGALLNSERNEPIPSKGQVSVENDVANHTVVKEANNDESPKELMEGPIENSKTNQQLGEPDSSNENHDIDDKQQETQIPEMKIPKVEHHSKGKKERTIKKTPSKFKQKIYKYFINSYDK